MLLKFKEDITPRVLEFTKAYRLEALLYPIEKAVEEKLI
jgi:hypothetical protein